MLSHRRVRNQAWPGAEIGEHLRLRRRPCARRLASGISGRVKYAQMRQRSSRRDIGGFAAQIARIFARIRYAASRRAVLPAEKGVEAGSSICRA